MPTKKKLPRINKTGGETITHNSDNSFWFSSDIEDWTTGHKSRNRQKLNDIRNDFKEHELAVQAFKGKRL